MRVFIRLAGLAVAGAIGLLALLAEAKTSITVTAVQIFGTVDPAKIKDYTEYMAAVNLYEGLTTVDPKGKILPLLAEKWEISEDSRNYRFHLVVLLQISNNLLRGLSDSFKTHWQRTQSPYQQPGIKG